MDGRDSIVTSGANLSSFYIQHRGIGGPSPATSAGLHGAHHGAHPSFRHLESGAGFSFQPPQLTGSHLGPGFQVETSPPVSQHNSSGGAKGPGGSGQDEQVKKKRGRPRKYKPDGAVTTLGLSSSPATPLSSSSGLVSVAAASGSGLGSGSGGGGTSEKRGRGRPPGSGKMQQLASLGTWLLGSVGTGFTPHVIIITSGEDIAARIMSFSQQGPRAVCIISATGAVSKAALLQSPTSGSVVTYEGRFEILCLSGSYLVTDDGGSRARTGGLCIALCGGPDHRVIGGSVGGVLTADGAVQVIVGSFMYGGSKKNKTKTEEESGDGSELNGSNQETHMSTLPNQNASLSPVSGAWPGLMRPMDSRSSNIDINSTRE